MNTTANKFYNLKNKVSFEMLNVSYVHFKKLSKIWFFKIWKDIVNNFDFNPQNY